MFNWLTAPTLAAMLLFWLLAAYVLTRTPTSAVSLAAVGAQVAAAVYFLAEAMQANATTPGEWLPWARLTVAGSVVAPTLWYGLTALLLREVAGPAARPYLRWVGYPLGGILTLGCVAVVAAAYGSETIFVWGTLVPRTAGGDAYFRYYTPPGALYPAFAGIVVAAMLGAIVHLIVAQRLPLAVDSRRLVGALLASAALFAAGAGALLAVTELALADWLIWSSHLVIAAGLILMAANVAAYNLLIRGQVLATDLLYFLSALGLLGGLYALVFVIAGPGYSFRLLELLVATLLLTVAAHALANVARRLFDRLFFSRDVRRLRAELESAAQSAGRVEDLPALVSHAQSELAAVTVEHDVRLTEEALRRLNKPGKLAQCGLMTRLPRTLAAARGGDASTTPLEEAGLLRETLVAAIERLKPSDASGQAAALHYRILRDEYVLGRPNAQIMTRHGISEATFHRNRREAIAGLAVELARQETLRRGEVESF